MISWTQILFKCKLENGNKYDAKDGLKETCFESLLIRKTERWWNPRIDEMNQMGVSGEATNDGDRISKPGSRLGMDSNKNI